MGLAPQKISLSIPDRRVLIHEADGKDRTEVVSHSTNVDASGPRTTMLRPGNILLKGADGIYYDDTSTGVGATQASVDSAEVPDVDWQSTTVTVNINGVDLVTVALGATDDTAAEVVTALNANAIFAAHCIAAVVATLVNIKTLAKGEDVYLLVTSSLATAYGASGTGDRGTDGDYVVCTDYVDQLGPDGVAKNAMAKVVKRGVFDESNLVWGGSSTISEEARLVLLKRGSRFE